jgi:hypothetical protein
MLLCLNIFAVIFGENIGIFLAQTTASFGKMSSQHWVLRATP